MKHQKTFVFRGKRYRVVLTTGSAADAKRKRVMYDNRQVVVKLDKKNDLWMVGVR